MTKKNVRKCQSLTIVLKNDWMYTFSYWRGMEKEKEGKIAISYRFKQNCARQTAISISLTFEPLMQRMKKGLI